MVTMGKVEISQYGEAAIRVVLGNLVDWELNQKVHMLRKVLMSGSQDGIVDLIPGYASLLVRFNPIIIGKNGVEMLIKDGLERISADLEFENRQVNIPVYYGGQFGPDIGRVAERTGTSIEEVIQLHASAVYRVFIIGFTPGFAYMGGLPSQLEMPRLATPRSAVPAGSVGIAGKQTGIYPLESPGGWQIIGWTPEVMFDAHRPEPCLLQPGDIVRFVPVEGKPS